MLSVLNERGRKEKKRRHKNRGAGIKLSILLCVVILICVTGCVSYLMHARELEREKPGKLLAEYVGHIEKQEYEEMYAMTTLEGKGGSDKEAFIERNSKI